MQRILLIGKNGQVGWELQRTCCTLGEVIALDYPEIDLAQPTSLRQVVADIKPSIIINAAAYTNVDKAEANRSWHGRSMRLPLASSRKKPINWASRLCIIPLIMCLTAPRAALMWKPTCPTP